jgi:hypothetical protein
MKNFTNLRALALLLLFAGLFSNHSFGQCADDDPSSPVGITPVTTSGNNPDVCTRFNDPVSTTYDLDAFGNTVTVEITNGPCGEVFSWSASPGIVIDQVIAKGGNAYNTYDYTGEDPRPDSDGNLHSPLNESGKYAALSHIDFCFHYRLTVSKTANAEYTRTYEWEIEKNCLGDETLILATGQTFNYPFSWKVGATYTDSDWKVTGEITIENNTPFDVTITSVTDELSGGIAATVDCPSYALASGETVVCTYSAELDEEDAVDGTNTVAVVSGTPEVEGATATADYTFGDPTTEVDECIVVEDDCGEPVEVCYEDAPHTEYYSCYIGSYDECGDYEYTNTAGFTTNDTETTGSDYCVVRIAVPCKGGCTLTQGYWKTHSEYGPAPYDATWALLPNGADTPFFTSGKTYYEILWTPPKGNPYYILAHQYIAAQLNFLNGADPTAAQAAFDAATILFNTWLPNQVAALRGPAGNTLRNQFTSLASILDEYNNGLIGPGHCSEEGGGEELSADFGAIRIAPSFGDLSEGEYTLGQNSPNPFIESTQFTFSLPGDTYVKITVLNLNGQNVATAVNGYFEAGKYAIDWTAPAELSSGMYLYRLETADISITKKMFLIRR